MLSRIIVGIVLVAGISASAAMAQVSITVKAVLKVDPGVNGGYRQGYSVHLMGISGGQSGAAFTATWDQGRTIEATGTSIPQISDTHRIKNPLNPSANSYNLDASGRWGGVDWVSNKVTLYPYYYTNPITWNGTAWTTFSSSLGSGSKQDGPSTL